MKLTLIGVAMILLPTLCAAEGLQLYTANPSHTSPGQSIQILGTGFTSATRIMLGSQRVTPTLLNPEQLQLLVPQLTEGEYALQLVTENQVSPQILSLRIELPAPSIETLNPSNIDECSTSAERQITIRGQNFQPGLHLLLNGAAVPASLLNQQQLSFAAPVLNAGIYGLQVVNPNGKRSLPYSLYFNNIPKIYSLSEGDNYVNSYQLIIQGKNFYPHSTLVVSEYQVGITDIPPRQRIISSRGPDFGRGTGGGHPKVQGDYLNYVGCNTLIYYRFPYSGQLKQLSLQVINRDGKSSFIKQISMP